MPVSIRFKGVVGTTAQLESDKYAGRIGFNTTLARYVVYFDATNYATMARRDVLETFAAGIQDSTLTAGLPMYAGTSGRLATESIADFRTRIDVAKASDKLNRIPATITGQNANSFVTSGVWVGANVVNAPNTAWGVLRVHRNGDDAGDQVWQTWTEARYQGGKIYVRGSADFGVTWDPWVSAIYNGGAASVTTLQTTGLATLAQATVSDLTTGRMVSTTTGGRLQTLNYVPLGNTTGGAGEPRIASGVVGGQVIIVSGLDVTDAGAFSYLQMNNATWQAGGTAVSTQITGTSFTALAPDVTLGNSGASSVVQFSATTVRKVISGTTEIIGGNIFNQYTAVTQSGIVTNQSLASTGAGSRTIGAGRLNSLGAGMELYLCGTYTTDAAPGNATIRVRIGSTTFRTIGSFALDPNITNGIWWIRGRITTRTTGATGTVGGQLMWEHQGSSAAGSEVMHVQPSTSTADVTVDLTASQTIDVDWTATDAGTSITCTCFSIDLIR